MPPHFPILQHQDSHHRQPSFTMIIIFRADWGKTCIESSALLPCSSFHLHCTARVICAARLRKIWYSTVHGRRGGRASRKTQWKECDKTREHTERSSSPIYLSYKTLPHLLSHPPSPLFPRSNSHSNHTSVRLLHAKTRRCICLVSSSSLQEPFLTWLSFLAFLFWGPHWAGSPPPPTPLGEPITHFAKQLTRQEMNQNGFLPIYP